MQKKDSLEIEEPTEKTVESSDTVETVIPKEADALGTPTINNNNEPMPRSRMRWATEQRSKKTLLITTLSLLALIGVLLAFGPSLLVNFSVLLGNLNGSEEKTNTNETPSYIAPPVLDPQPDATNSARIHVSGVASAGTQDQIKLYVNDEVLDVTHPKTNDMFTFDNVPLKEGENEIKAITIIKDKKSDYSSPITILYLKEPPELIIDEPKDGDSFNGDDSPFMVKGKTNPGARVTINDFLPITKDDGTFSYSLPLQNGENKIKVIATDKAGNKTEKEIKVTYSQ